MRAGLSPRLGIVSASGAAHPGLAASRQRLAGALARSGAGAAGGALGFPGGAWILPDRAFAAVAEVPAPQGILAVFSLPPEAAGGEPPYVLALDGVQDPGNVGALIRPLLAFCGPGAALWTGPETADPYGSKALRASAGAALHLRRHGSGDLAADLAQSALAGRRWWALCPRGGRRPDAVELRPPLGLLIGSEGRGVDPALLPWCEPLSIPMPGGAESLNAAMAGGIVLYECARQAPRP